MELDVCLTRSGDESWGFRLLGGTDFGMPLTVVKVVPRTPAAAASLLNGDVVTRIEDTDASTLSHDQSKQAVASATDALMMKVVRGLYDPVLDDTEPLYESVDQLTDQSQDFDQPSLPTEVEYPDLSLPRFIEQPGPLPLPDLLDQSLFPPLDAFDDKNGVPRSSTASPFATEFKPYRPFSTEPITEVPSLEDPIILNPGFHDVFGRLKDEEEFLPVTRFKLPISEQYDPDGSKMRLKLMKERGEATGEKKDVVFEEKTKIKYEETQMKDQVMMKDVFEEKTNIKYEETEIKGQAIMNEEIAFLEEMKKEIDIDKIEMTASSVVDESIEKAVTVAEEIKKEMTVDLNEVTAETTVEESTKIDSKEELEVVTEDKIAQVTVTNEVVELVELLDKTTDELIKHNEHNVKEKSEVLEEAATTEQKETCTLERKVSVHKTDENVTDTKVKTVIDALNTSVEESSIVDEQESQVNESNTKVSQKSTERSAEETATQNTSATDKTYSTSKLLAEQKAYVIGLQTIPNIRGTVHSSYHYDLLLRTFFIHLTDVMVALSRIILAEPVLSQTTGQTVAGMQSRKDVTEMKETVSVQKQEVKEKDKVKQVVQKQDEHIQIQDKKDVKELVKVFTANNQEAKQIDVSKVTARQEQKSNVVSAQKEKIVQEQQKPVEKSIKENTQQNLYKEINKVDMTNNYMEEVSKKLISGSKMAQRTEKKSKELMQNMEAVITEFESKSGGEDIEAVRERRSKSRSRPESRAEGLLDEFGEEKSSQLLTEVSSAMSNNLESTTTKSRYETGHDTITSTGDNNTYVAIVEAHVYTNKDAIFEESLSKSESTAVHKQAIEAKEVVEVVKSAAQAKTSAKAVETKKATESVESKKVTVQDNKEVVKKVFENNIDIKKAEIKAVARKETKREEIKQEAIQEVSLENKTVTTKENKAEVVTKVKQEDKEETQEVIIAKHEKQEKMEVAVAKHEEKQNVEKIIIAKDVKEMTKEMAVLEDKKVEIKEVFIEEVEPINASKEIIQNQKYLITEAAEGISSVASNGASATEIVTAQLTAAAEKLAVNEVEIQESSVKKEEIQESVVKKLANETVQVKEKSITEKSVTKKQTESTEKNKKEVIAQTAEIIAAKEDVSSKQSLIAESIAITEHVAKEENKITEAKSETLKEAVSIKEENKAVVDVVAAVETEKESEIESTFIFKKPVEENITKKVDNIQNQKVEKSQEKELVIETNGVYESHIEINDFKSEHIENDSTFVAKMGVRDLQLSLKTDLVKQDSQTSVTSAENGIDTPTPLTVPPTPLTDEYMFKLVIPLPKLSAPPPPRDCTPSDDEEDLQIGKRGLVPVVESEIEAQTIFDPPLPTPPVSPRSPGSPRSPTYTKPGLKGGALKSPIFRTSLPVVNAHTGNDGLVKMNAKPAHASSLSANNPSSGDHEDPNIVKKTNALEALSNAHSKPTPVACKVEEDPHIVKQRLVPNAESNKPNQILINPLSASPTTPMPINSGPARSPKFPVYIKPGLYGGAPMFSGFYGTAKTPKFPMYTKAGLRGGADRDYTKEEILEIERKSSLLASAIDETIKSIEEYKEEVGISKETTEEQTTNGVIYNGYAKVVETKLFDTSVQEKSASEDSITVQQHKKVRIAEVPEEIEVAKEITDTMPVENGIASVETEIDTEDVKIANDVIEIVRDREEVFEPTPVIEVAEQTFTQQVVQEEATRDPMEGFRTVHFDPEELLNAQRERRALGVRIPELTASQEREMYKTESGQLIGTKRGIVDGLKEAVVDPDFGKQLGKPGITEEKIAELISGESEMLREAHVMGLTRVLTSHMNKDDDSSVDFKKIKPTIESLKDSEVLKALNEEMLKVHEEKKKQEEKNWTTFLQKPKRPVPRNKFGYYPPEEEKPEPYKVKIVKQPKPKVAPDYKPKDFNTGLLPWEERALREPTPPPVAPEDPILIPEDAPEILEAVDPLPESEVPDLEDSGIPLPPPEPEVPPPPPEETEGDVGEAEVEAKGDLDLKAVVEETEQIVEENLAEMERNNIAEQLLMSVQNMVDPNASLDQQLAQMRAQLAALAQLPGVIQQSLELVNRQLSQLSQLETTQDEVIQETATETVEDAEAPQPAPVVEEAPDTTPDPQPEAEVIEETPAEKSLTPEELELMKQEEEAMIEEQMRAEKQKKDYKEVIVDYVDKVEAVERTRLEHETKKLENIPLTPQSCPPEGKTGDKVYTARLSLSPQEIYMEEAMERARLEHESRQVKEHSCPRVGKPKPAFGPVTPQERPLVLPGGRRWRKPKDAYNEQFIAETLQAQAEIISGKTMGINFMKYEKPPVSLDHLKHSDVYKLIHSMDEKPLKRTDLLTPVIAEADYREKCRSMTPCPERLAQQVQP